MTDESPFLVDLRGVVDLLSHHLYSSPRVYLRELVQNGVDALTARRAHEPSAPGRITITPADVAEDGRLHVVDTGIGLDDEGIRSVLATIGASSKRDELGLARDSFLGQFGIGLLSCFLVSDEIEVRTRRCEAAGGTGETWQWVGRSRGTYAVRRSQDPLPAAGTEVLLTPLRGHADLLRTDAVRAIVREAASFLPVEIVLVTERGEEVVSREAFPWERPDLTGVSRRAAAMELCEDLLGFSPLDVVELSDAESGTRGFAFVLPQATVQRGVHRLYSKRMLVSAEESQVLPDWAFFVRAVLDTEQLRLTASRESLHDDELRDETRDRLGGQLKRWLLRMVESDPTRAEEFFRVHHLGVKAMATQDDSMLEVVARVMTWETTEGALTLRELGGLAPVITYVDNVDEYLHLAPLARAQGLAVLNAGYAYDTLLLERWLATTSGLDSRRLTQRELVSEFEELSGADTELFAPLLEVARVALERSQTVPSVRWVAPETLHAVLLHDRESRRELDRQLVAEASDDVWSAALAAFAQPDLRPQLVLNAANPVLRRLAASADRALQQTAVEALYAQALLSGRHPLRPFDNALVSRALPALIDRAVDGA